MRTFTKVLLLGMVVASLAEGENTTTVSTTPYVPPTETGGQTGGGDPNDTGDQINSTTITTTTTEVGPGDIGNDVCQGLSGNPAACKKNAECELDMDGTMCNKVAGNGGGSSEARCVDVTQQAECGSTSGCSWDSTFNSCEIESDSREGSCVEVDTVMEACKKLTTESACGKEDSCSWDKSASIAECLKNKDWDPNNCKQQADQEACGKLGYGEADVVASGCEWVDANFDPNNDDETAACVVASTEIGTGGTGGDGGERQRCSDITSETDCANFGVVDTGGPDSGGSGQTCAWTSYNDGGGGGGEGFACSKFDTTNDCNAKMIDGRRACQWDDPQAGESGGPGDDAGAGGNDTPFEDDLSQCIAYDWCTPKATEAACGDEVECTWRDGVCQTGGGADMMGCAAITTVDACSSWEGDESNNAGGEGQAGGFDDDPNPFCMWSSKDRSGCEPKDRCRVQTTEPSCAATTGCEWDDPSRGCMASVVDSGTVECLTQLSSASCNKNKGCEWMDESEESCIDWRKCFYLTESACAGASDEGGCYWDGYSCEEGVPPTYTTTTSVTFTRTTTTTTTTTFHCDPSTELLCDSLIECYKIAYKCDGGQPDCADGSDEKERECTTSTTTEKPLKCESTDLPCDDGSSCHPAHYFCDGQPDCDDGGDEKDCPSTRAPVDKTTVATATSKTTTSSTTSKTTTTTTTTDPECVVMQACVTREQYEDAVLHPPLFSTPLKCRVCATGRRATMLCAEFSTMGCPGAGEIDNPDSKQSALDRAFEAKNLRLKIPPGIEQADIEDTLFDRLPKLAGFDTSALVDVIITDMPGVTSAYKLVNVYVTKVSGAWENLEALPKRTEVAVGATVVDVYNSQLVDVDHISGGPKDKETGGGTDTGTDAPFDPEAAKGKGFYYPTFSGLVSASSSEIATVAAAWGISAGGSGSLRDAVLQENVRRLWDDQSKTHGYLMPSAIASAPAGPVQQYLAKQLGLDISNVPPALIESALQHENEHVMDTMLADGGSSSGEKPQAKAAAKKGGKGGVVVVLVVLAIAGIAGVVMLKRKRDQENGGAHSRLEMTEFQNPVARDTTYSDAIGGSDA